MARVKVPEGPNDPAALARLTLYHLADMVQDDLIKQTGSGYAASTKIPTARPYLEAMQTLPSIAAPYGFDTGESVVAYFLANAQAWKGDVARQIKAELRRRLDEGDRVPA